MTREELEEMKEKWEAACETQRSYAMADWAMFNVSKLFEALEVAMDDLDARTA